MKKLATAAITVLLALGLTTCGSNGGDSISPEMQEFLDAFGSKEKLARVVDKYGKEGVVPIQISKCLLEHPEIKESMKKDGIQYYRVAARVTNCDCEAKAVGTVRIFTLGWKDGKIVSFEWQGTESEDEYKHFGTRTLRPELKG